MKPLDLQVNGCAGVDFNADDLDEEQVLHAAAWMKEQGAAAFLPTLITAEFGVLEARLARLDRILCAHPELEAVVPGIHLEGPFLSGESGYVGAHPPEHVLPAAPDRADRLLDAAGGRIRLVTLAPECDPAARTTRHLTALGVSVAAGHTNASLEDLRRSIDEGLSLFTHLGNGCPPELPRHDNVIQRALSLAGDLCFSFIPDGMHVDFFALKNYLRCAGPENCLVVTDAISAAGGEPGRHPLAGGFVTMGEDGVPRIPDGTQFAGSALGWRQLLDNLRNRLGLDEKTIRLLVETNPNRILHRP